MNEEKPLCINLNNVGMVTYLANVENYMTITYKDGKLETFDISKTPVCFECW